MGGQRTSEFRAKARVVMLKVRSAFIGSCPVNYLPDIVHGAYALTVQNDPDPPQHLAFALRPSSATTRSDLIDVAAPCAAIGIGAFSN